MWSRVFWSQKGTETLIKVTFPWALGDIGSMEFLSSICNGTPVSGCKVPREESPLLLILG